MEPELMFAMHQDRVREVEQAIARRRAAGARPRTAPRRSVPLLAVVGRARTHLATWSRAGRSGAVEACCAPA
jgi:hypothetical protein